MKKQLTVLALIALSMALIPVTAHAVTETTDQEEVETTSRERERAEDQTREREDAEESLRERIANAKEAAKERALQAKAEAQERKLTLAADRCEAMKEKLVAVVPRLGNGVTSVKTSLDKNYDRIVAVHESGKLDTPDYDTLVSAVDEAKTAAEASMALVDPSSITIDCDNKGLGTQLDDYRSVIKAARDDLKSYHKALVDLVSAMNASSAKDEETTDESN